MNEEKIFEFERSVNQILFHSVLGKFYNDSTAWENEYENNEFKIKEYDYSDDRDEPEREPNLFHKPTGFKLWWYKYPLRSPVVNMDITHEQFLAILYDCLESLGLNHTYYEKWWDNEPVTPTRKEDE